MHNYIASDDHLLQEKLRLNKNQYDEDTHRNSAEETTIKRELVRWAASS